MSDTVLLKVRKKGVTILPKQLRKDAGIEEDSEVKAKALPHGGGLILRPLTENPIATLQNLPTSPRRSSSVERVRKLRKKIDRQVRG
jgi:bifunctional DNA-binding transcriptional regulator/antitoxin component of YhaV-PrlF toxin-antitoxin module